MTTPRELALEALARATAATKGPWEDAQGSVWENGARKVTEEFVRCPGDNVALAADIIDPRTSLPSPANSKFIAHAREDVPALALAVIALSDKLEAREPRTTAETTADLTHDTALDALARVIETTRGPWRVKGNDVLAPDDVDCPRGYNPENIVAECRTPEDAEFFAHAKDDILGMSKTVAALSKRVRELERTLKGTLANCDRCDALATRSYHHVSGHHMVVCDNDRCHEENFCDECGQVWYGDNPKCEAFKDGGVPCTGTSKHAKSTAYHLRDLPYAAVIRSLR